MKGLKVYHSLFALLIVMVFALSFNYAYAEGLAQYRNHIRQLEGGNPTLDYSVEQVTSDFVNGGFETGDFSGWVAGDNGLPGLWPWEVVTFGSGYFLNSNPIEGRYDALNGFDGEAGYEAFLYQDVQVPDGGGKVSLWDRIQYDGLEIPSELPRIYEVQIRDPNDNILEVPVHVEIMLNGQPYTDLGWQMREFDVSQYAGKMIRVYIWLFVPEDFTGPAQFEVDDFALVGEEPFGHIKGLVTDCETGDPIESVKIIAIKRPTRVTTFTDEDGLYYIFDLEPGEWWLIGLKRGYKVHIAQVVVKAGETTKHEFCMEPK